MAVISPWTVRNYLVLGDFIPVSSNGGSVLYRAKNPLARGGYSTRGERDLDALRGNEAEWNRTGVRWAVVWIKDNPLEFVELVFHKQRLFLANDYSGAYYAFNRFVQQKPDSTLLENTVANYFRAAGNFWWVSLWILVASSLLSRADHWRSIPSVMLLLLPLIYLLGIHSVFES